MNAVREVIMRRVAPFILTCSARVGLVALCGVTLAACSGEDVSRAFGLKRPTPDEYTVTTRTPLSMPPSEVLVTPGSPQAHRPEESPRMQALETLSPDIALHEVQAAPSDGQSALVKEAKAAAQGPQNAELGDTEAGFVDHIMFWQAGRSGSVVDGVSENQRIQKNMALGRNVAEGATPTMAGK
ncbi:DUF3035 domain-containing protein [Acetobacteraceae bacterium ESL0709]|nr:DUF3035 domain-containing protein [Acetobacteraceae bacterium ESL0697]MDF7678490.1 DUF3035 domain-containing protein [Acetobacteraceae bacterium ESL0709]